MTQAESANYCTNLTTAGFSWKMESGCTQRDTCELHRVYRNNPKLINYY